MGSGHAGIGEIGRSPVENSLVRGLHVSVRADDGRGAPGEVSPEGDLLGCGLGVKIDKNDGCLSLQPIHLGGSGLEGTVDGGHEGASL